VEVNRRRGFTLAEAVIAGGITTIMFAASMAALTVATRTVDPPREVAVSRQARAALDLFRQDLEGATAITSHTGQSITVSVPDRTGDGAGDTITYSYRSGARTLVRTDAAGADESLLTAVADFSLKAFSSRGPSAPTISEVTTEYALVASPNHGASIDLAPSTLAGYAIVTAPVLPSSTSSWKVTGLRVRGRRGSSPSNSVTFALRTVSGGLPSSTVLATVDVRGTAFPVSTDWVTIDWPDVTVPDGTTSLGVTITSASLLTPAFIEATDIVRNTPWDALFNGTLVLWTVMSRYDLSYELLGTVSTPQSTVKSRAAAIFATLTVDAAPGQSFSTVATLRNLPEAAVAVAP
jgi:hypothetical protein